MTHNPYAGSEDEPPSPEGQNTYSNTPSTEQNSTSPVNGNGRNVVHVTSTVNGNLFGWVKSLFRNKNESDLQEVFEEYIDSHNEEDPLNAISMHERTLISNVLDVRNSTVVDVMIPRADIVAIEEKISAENLLKLLSQRQHSRLPVYRENLDEVLGTIHIKDVLAVLAKDATLDITQLIREVPIIAPSMPVLDLLLQMRNTRKHMALVVDEYGGIDGLVTIGDVIEAIVGEIDDEYDEDIQAQMIKRPDGSVIADARVDIDEFEERFGQVLSEEEREDVDTLAGLAFSIAGRVPARGEVLEHDTGMEIEILDADPRRIQRLRIRNIPDDIADS